MGTARAAEQSSTPDIATSTPRRNRVAVFFIELEPPPIENMSNDLMIIQLLATTSPLEILTNLPRYKAFTVRMVTQFGLVRGGSNAISRDSLPELTRFPFEMLEKRVLCGLPYP